jgi:Conserved region of unknown function on GLTSCR protein
VLYPDTETPFVDTLDVVHRLLPYHVFQHPREDLDVLVKGRIASDRSEVSKWKPTEQESEEGNARLDDLRREIKGIYHGLVCHASKSGAETAFALECFKRREALQNRFKRAKIRAGKVGHRLNWCWIYNNCFRM